LADKGLKRICPGCNAVYYDFNKRPITCPSCDAKFTGDIKVRSRRARAASETKVPAATQSKVSPATEADTKKPEDDVVDLESVDEKDGTGSVDGDDDQEAVAADLDLDELANIDDQDSDDDLDDDSDIDVDIKVEKDDS